MTYDPSKYADLSYSTEWLVRAAATNRAFLDLKSPRDPRVLQAIGRVDRRRFLDDTVVTLNHAQAEDLDRLAATLFAIQGAESSRIIIPGSKPGPTANDLRISAIKTLRNLTVASVPVRELAYNDVPYPIGYEMSCSQPSLVAFMDDVLDLQPGYNILEVGAGCGYHAAVTAELIGKDGRLTTVEIVPGLAVKAARNLREYENVNVLDADGSRGYAQNSPYDRIYFTAGSKRFDPFYLINQLNEGGILLYPDDKAFNLLRRKGNEFSREQFGNVVFTPLTGENA
ncbi:MAG TPA: hypothetical protein VI968_02490 [archaeon]|nr:hypothetical protein [archaeon]